MEIFVARRSGFCYGVKRALSLVYDVLKENRGPLYSLGPLIHNPQVIKDLEEKGLKVIDDIKQIEKGSLVIRTHGVPPKVFEEAQNKEIKILDATCPTVRKVQQYAKSLKEEGYQVIIVGDKGHPEVSGIMGYAEEKAIVISDKEEINKHVIQGRIGMVIQTTQTWDNFISVLTELVKTVEEIKVFNTLCSSTESRYRESIELAEKVDTVLVIGGVSSANTARLTQLCRQVQPHTFQIEDAEDIDILGLEGGKKIGITAGASTPDWFIEDIREKLLSKFVVH
jgi:(E)-4-hydroxy-3-methyl-but-2-enyl pyrophosphate reductase